MARTISHYRIEEEIGRGGMGVVYRAVDTRLGRAVAIKMLPPETTADADRLRRFVQEARAASALNHPNIVTIFDIDEDAATTFIVMELVEGATLDRVLARRPLPVETALDYGAQIGAALEAAHAHGIVHRDVKPGNVMVTPDGRIKVLDFGLAKLLERDPSLTTMTGVGTRSGVIMGTAAYMSPEQAEGRQVDARSDVFSFGAVLYEMLTGRRPFAGNSDLGVITSILRDQPPSLRSIRSELPGDAQAIVDRCLAKDPAARYAHAGDARSALDTLRAQLTRRPDTFWRRPAVIVPVVLVLAAIAAFGAWQTMQSRRARWVRNEAIPEIQRLQTTNRSMDAVRLASQAERYAPDDIAGVRQGWYRFNLVTIPDGAHVEIRNYLNVNGPWQPLGATPVRDLRLPFGYYRVRITKPGYVPIEITASMAGRPPIVLRPEASAQPGMVPVPGGTYSVGIAGTVTLPDFWMDRVEVTNRDFKRFVDAGGYRNPKFWTEPFRDGSEVVSFENAMARFRDSTGRSGPASWQLGSYPDGQADFPVGGISWFEAAAYAVYAGKSLPTVYHWYRAAGPDELSSDILQLSNFDGKGPTRAGERQGVGPFGTLDMAGNVKEWCANASRDDRLRYLLGGSWDEPAYRYTEEDAQDPWLRRPTFGVRLVKNLGPVGEAAAPVGRVYGDPKSVVPVSDELFDVYRRFYAYDRAPLNARVDSVDDSSPYWRAETISFDAAYAGERVPAYLFLPKNAAPPFQTVVVFPSGYALNAGSSRNLDYSRFDFIVRSGRAVLYPVYQGTYERRRPSSGGQSEARDMQVQWAKDLFRAVDYLATRKEIDLDKLAYYSLSMGAYFGPIPVSLEPRIKVAVFASGGLRFNYPPEIQPANFAPHVKVPVLMINGHDDFQAPLAAQQRLFDLLGTPPERKKHVVLEGGHVPNDALAVIREVLGWFDTYLGPAG